MRVEGKTIANQILNTLKSKVKELKKKDLVPTLGVISVGQNKDSLLFINQKKKKAAKIGAKITLKKVKKQIAVKKLIELTKSLDYNPAIKGIVVQLPLPSHIKPRIIQSWIRPIKDVDGSLPKSLFTPPVALAVLEILKKIHLDNLRGAKNTSGIVPNNSPEVEKKAQSRQLTEDTATPPRRPSKDFTFWLKSKKILIIGRGETAGKPIIKTLRKMGLKPLITHSKSRGGGNLFKTADIIISCVGKKEIVEPEMIKKGIILISVGLHQKLNRWVGDYDEKKISKIASFYTPTPGGVGPLNVAFLMKNLVEACQKQKH